MQKVNKSYQIRLNISVILMTILLGAVVISTFSEYSELTDNQMHIVDFEDDVDSEEIENKDLSHANSNTDGLPIERKACIIITSTDLMEVRYGKTPTPPPEL
ncbi:MAG: hypothetical protein ACI8ZM_000665 [Crocinitomix sp.]|jgi:hypothetical protein